MKLKDKSEIQSLVNEARDAQGFASSGDDAADQVMSACASVAGMYGDVAAIPIATIIALAMQLLPIIFGDGGFTIEKLQAVLQLILSIFTTN